MHRPVEKSISPPQHLFFFWVIMCYFDNPCLRCTTCAFWRHAGACLPNDSSRAAALMHVFVCSQRRCFRLRRLCSACTRVICQHLSAFVITSQAFSLKVLDGHLWAFHLYSRHPSILAPKHCCVRTSFQHIFLYHRMWTHLVSALWYASYPFIGAFLTWF